MLTFKIIPKCYQDASAFSGEDVDFYIELDAWDDYTYHVMYHLHATKKLTGNKNEYLGYIKFMHPGQLPDEMYVLHERMGDKAFTEIPEDMVGLTFSINIYKGLNRYVVNVEERKGIVDQLHLILDKESKYYQMVEGDPCFDNGVLRDTTMENFALKKAQSLLLSCECLYDLRKESFVARFADNYEDIVFNFSCLDDSVMMTDENKSLIPNGVMVFIGANGSGKSTMMYRLAKLMYTYPEQRGDLIEDVGELVPNNLGISKLFLVSYSPFDNFTLPLEDYKDRISGQRMIFCGIRDLDAEYEALKENGELLPKDEMILQDRQSLTKIKSTKLLAKEFAENMDVIKAGNDRYSLWDDFSEAARELHPEVAEIAETAKMKDAGELEKLYLGLSTGNKYLMHMLSHVIAHIEEDSLLLFDEPENHIHPPLLSFLLEQLRYILLKNHSVMFISTHSPVILQEVFANNVYVVSNHNGFTATHPDIETYGANIGEITTEVFNLTSDNTNYYQLFKRLYHKWDMECANSVEDMLEKFKEKLGHSISEQLTAYLIDLYDEANEA